MRQFVLLTLAVATVLGEVPSRTDEPHCILTGFRKKNEVECKNIQYDSQVEEILKREFKLDAYKSLTVSSSNLTSFGNVLAGKKFITIALDNLESLEVISDDWLDSTKDVVEGITISHNPSLSKIPEVHSKSLELLSISYSKVEVLPTGVFSGLENMKMLTLLSNNLLKKLEARSIVVRKSGAAISLMLNKINEIEPEAIQIEQGVMGVMLILSYNQITEVRQDVFEPLFPSLMGLSLEVNPLKCGCDMAWIVRNEEYFNFFKRQNGRIVCPNRRRVMQLTPDDFRHCK